MKNTDKKLCKHTIASESRRIADDFRIHDIRCADNNFECDMFGRYFDVMTANDADGMTCTIIRRDNNKQEKHRITRVEILEGNSHPRYITRKSVVAPSGKIKFEFGAAWFRR